MQKRTPGRQKSSKVNSPNNHSTIEPQIPIKTGDFVFEFSDESEDESTTTPSTINSTLYAKMKTLLIDLGHNLLLYGIGSKKEFIDSFASKMLSSYPVVTVRAYQKISNLEGQILINIAQAIGNTSTKPEQIWKLLLRMKVEKSLPPLIVIVHSADSLQNRRGNGTILKYPFSSGGDLFLFLKKLTNNFPTFRFLLTVDRIDWFNSRCVDFHFVYLCINTYQTFAFEKCYSSSSSKDDVDLYEIATRSVAILQKNEKKVLEILLDTILFQHQRAQQLAELEKRSSTSTVRTGESLPSATTQDTLLLSLQRRLPVGDPSVVSYSDFVGICTKLLFLKPQQVNEMINVLYELHLIDIKFQSGQPHHLSSIMNEYGIHKLYSEIKE